MWLHSAQLLGVIMGSWFDALAKRSAGSTMVDDVATGPTRRQVILGGAAVTGAVWTAPMLLAAQPAFAAGASQCPNSAPNFELCPPDNAQGICCPDDEVCFINPSPKNANDTFICDVPVGGDCGNRGFGTNCAAGRARCNQASSSDRDPICGGIGAACPNGSDTCEFENCASGFCGGEGAVCTSSAECSPGSTQNANVKTCCSGGFCRAAAC